MMHVQDRRQFRFNMPQMEGPIAAWYARVRGSHSQIEAYRAQARQLTDGVPSGASVLEVAPGPGYLAIEIARLGHCQVTGLDISHSFVRIASDHARQAGVSVNFRQGDAGRMPFDAESFDLVICQAAFKNFQQPGSALDEMYRVLRSGGTAVIQDMRRDASNADIGREVKGMQLGWLNAVMTRTTLKLLRLRAYSRAQFERLAAASAFRTADVLTEGIGVEVRLTKPAPSP
jgi:ubiquinone/menaquinone biosynthesis C-methylase UbiE